MNESTFRSKFTRKLRELGWMVYEEERVWKNGKYYCVDIIAYHPSYRDLGWLVIEAKTAEKISTMTEAHRQITTQYINSFIDRNNSKPICFAILAPWIPTADASNYYDGNWKYILRFFTRYGIGVINNAERCVIFCTERSVDVWSQLLLDPTQMSERDIGSLPKLKQYLIKKVEGL